MMLAGEFERWCGELDIIRFGRCTVIARRAFPVAELSHS